MQQPVRPQLARALVLVGVFLLVVAGLGEVLVAGDPLGWAMLALAVVTAAAVAVLWRHGSFRRP